MNLDYIQNNAVTVNGFVYRPAVVPVDYCGTIVYNAALHLIDGTPVNHSSLELAETDGEDARFAGTVALMQRSVDAAGLRPRCDYLDAALTKAYRELCGLPQPSVAVSGCLAGECCRYDGGANLVAAVQKLVEAGEAVPICPEAQAGLPTPRTPCERRGGAVLSHDGDDLTKAFARGAKLALKTVRIFDVHRAILKEKSPSCGSHLVYDGTFSGKVIPGEGLTAALLREAGVEIQTEEDFQ